MLLVSGSGTGLTGQTPTISIQRRSDSKWWDGSAWQNAKQAITMTQTDAVNLPGDYSYAFNQASAGGGTEEYLVRYEQNGVAPNIGIDEEQHVFIPFASTLVPEKKLGIVMSDDGINVKISVWMEEGGLRANNYNSMAAQVKDPSGNLIVDLGTATTQSVDGVFSFLTTDSAIVRNTPYLVTVQATRGASVDLVQQGFVRV
jgi:hypothetical protein